MTDRTVSPRGLLPVLAAAAVALGALLALAPAAVAHSAKTRHCAPVVFTPNSEDSAAAIRATRIRCSWARTFIRDSGGRPDAFYRGFRCTSRRYETAEALPYTRYRCVAGSRVIRWKRY